VLLLPGGPGHITQLFAPPKESAYLLEVTFATGARRLHARASLRWPRARSLHLSTNTDHAETDEWQWPHTCCWCVRLSPAQVVCRAQTTGGDKGDTDVKPGSVPLPMFPFTTTRPLRTRETLPTVLSAQTKYLSQGGSPRSRQNAAHAARGRENASHRTSCLGSVASPATRARATCCRCSHHGSAKCACTPSRAPLC